MVVLTTGHTTTTRVLSVLADTSLSGGDMALSPILVAEAVGMNISTLTLWRLVLENLVGYT